MDDEVQEVRIVGQRISVDDSIGMLDTMIGALEVLLSDPLRLVRLGAVFKRAQDLAAATEKLGQ